MVSIYVTLLQFFLREQMTKLGPHLGGGSSPLDLSVRKGDRQNLAMGSNCAQCWQKTLCYVKGIMMAFCVISFI